MAKHDLTKKLFQEEVDSRMELFPNYERIKKVTVIDRLFELERGEMTPSLKIRRKAVSENFESEIDAMYNSDN